MRYIDILAFVTLAAIASPVQAEVKEISPKEEVGKKTEANVYFTSEVSKKSITDLVAVLDQVRINHSGIEKINLLINSPGGNMDAGIQAYWSLKSYPLPIHAINVGDVSSAATFLYCAADVRSALPGATFLLHPAAAMGQAGYIKPDVIERERKSLAESNLFFSRVYEKCTNLDSNEIKDMLKAEYNSKFLNTREAEKIGLSSDTIEKIPLSAASFFIQDKD